MRSKIKISNSWLIICPTFCKRRGYLRIGLRLIDDNAIERKETFEMNKSEGTFMSEQFRTKLLGDLGEYLLTWHLRSKFGINVSLVKVEGIDLLCRDEEGILFPKHEYIAVSVRTRERKKDKTHDSVKVDWDEVEKASERWSAKPYFAYIRIVPEKGEVTIFLLPVSKARTYGKNFNVRRAEREPSNILFKMEFTPYPKLEEWRPAQLTNLKTAKRGRTEE